MRIRKELIGRTVWTLGIGLFCASIAVQAQTTTLAARPGGKVRIEGTSTIHDWQVEGKLIGGTAKVGEAFPLEPGQEVQPGPVEAQVSAFIPVTSLKSLKKDGSPYSAKMDKIMYESMKEPSNKRITYTLGELTLKESPQSPDLPYVYEAKGDLVVAGVTNAITMPVDVTPLGDNKVKFAGSTDLKMTSFGIKPPSPKVALGLIKTGDDVKVFFEWITAKKAPAN